MFEYTFLFILFVGELSFTQQVITISSFTSNTKFTLTLTDSLNADKIASADIFYYIEDNTKASDEDKEISKATPNADDKTKFTIIVNGIGTKIKIKAIL